LVELVEETSKVGIQLFLGGGYGLYLKQLHLMASATRTLLPREAWPRPRATADLDIFVPTEVIVALEQMVQLQKVLDRLGYQPLPDARFMHFDRAAPQGKVRVELLTGPIPAELQGNVKISQPRVRPKGDVQLHAYLTREAIGLEVEPFVVPLENEASVTIPNAFSLLLMKLHACHDRLGDENKQLGRHHALDVCRLLAMLTEPELALAQRLRREYRDDDATKNAAIIVEESFAEMTSLAVLRMREHALASAEMQVEQSFDLLHDLFLDN
jgi:Nucleotidyl transferase AbiEii toxin, Type IV TA system